MPIGWADLKGVNMDRITITRLKLLCERINDATNSPHEPYANGKACVGNFHISQAYGGYCLHRMGNEGGGVGFSLPDGHVTARELWDLMHAFLRGYEMRAKEERQ